MSEDKFQKETKTFTEEDFAEEYEKLCKDTGYRIAISPTWIMRDDNTFSMQLKYSVEPLREKSAN